MPRLTASQWEDVRAEREAGTSFGKLAAKYNICDSAIVRRAHREEWGDGKNIDEIVRRKVSEKISGVVSSADPVKKAAAVDAAAERALEIVKRHQEETAIVRERVYAGLKAHRAAETKEEKALAFDDLKAAKIASETMQIIHSMERKAWHLDADAGQPIIVIERSYG